MKPRVVRLLVLAANLLCAALLPGRACAAEDPELFKVLANYAVKNDSNLFRLRDGEQPIIDNRTRSRSDTHQTGELGLAVERELGQQHWTADASYSRTYYSEFDFLDFPAANYDAKWDWAVGRRWLGVLSASQAESQRSFADFSSPTLSVNTYRSYTGSADIRVLPAWTFGAGITRVTSDYSDRLSAGQEYDEDAWSSGFTYRATSGNEIAISIREADGTYPNRDDVSVADSSYRQRDIRVDGRYAFGGRSVLTGYLGIARRTYPRTSFRNYSGPIGRLLYQWSVTQKLQLDVLLRRELGAKEDLTDTYVVTSAGALTLDWKLTGKISAKVWGERQSRDYQGDPGFGLVPTSGAKDDQVAYGFGLTYKPIRQLAISSEYGSDARILDAGGFDNSTILLEVRFTY